MRIGMNSRLDTIQAAVLQVKLQAFREYEEALRDKVAERYTEALKDVVRTPEVRKASIPVGRSMRLFWNRRSR